MGETRQRSRDAESRLGGEDPLVDALSDRLGFQAQGGDFASVGYHAGAAAVIAVGESMSTAAALWGALEQADADLGLLLPRRTRTTRITPGTNAKPRIKGLGGGERRAEHGDGARGVLEPMMRVLRASYGSVDNATTTLSKDCSIGHGCIPSPSSSRHSS